MKLEIPDIKEKQYDLRLIQGLKKNVDEQNECLAQVMENNVLQDDPRLNRVIEKALKKTETSTKFQLAQILLGFDKQDDEVNMIKFLNFVREKHLR